MVVVEGDRFVVETNPRYGWDGSHVIDVVEKMSVWFYQNKVAVCGHSSFVTFSLK